MSADGFEESASLKRKADAEITSDRPVRGGPRLDEEEVPSYFKTPQELDDWVFKIIELLAKLTRPLCFGGNEQHETSVRYANLLIKPFTATFSTGVDRFELEVNSLDTMKELMRMLVLTLDNLANYKNAYAEVMNLGKSVSEFKEALDENAECLERVFLKPIPMNFKLNGNDVDSDEALEAVSFQGDVKIGFRIISPHRLAIEFRNVLTDNCFGCPLTFKSGDPVNEFSFTTNFGDEEDFFPTTWTFGFVSSHMREDYVFLGTYTVHRSNETDFENATYINLGLKKNYHSLIH